MISLISVKKILLKSGKNTWICVKRLLGIISYIQSEPEVKQSWICNLYYDSLWCWGEALCSKKIWKKGKACWILEIISKTLILAPLLFIKQMHFCVSKHKYFIIYCTFFPFLVQTGEKTHYQNLHNNWRISYIQNTERQLFLLWYSQNCK